MLRVIITIAVVTLATDANAIDLCQGGHRADRKVTCIVDGDTGWERGIKWRLVSIDAPETGHAECPAEHAMGDAATERLIEHMARGYRVEPTGERGNTREHRELVRVVLADGRDAGAVLLAESLAQHWPNYRNPWCGG